MIIRAFQDKDIKDLERIHQDYENEFSLSEFNDSRFSDLFVVEQDSRVISLGGIRTLAEVVIVTDKTIPTKDRVQGLQLIRQTSAYIARKNGFDSIHAFVQDKVWLHQLLRNGFRQTQGVALVCDVD